MTAPPDTGQLSTRDAEIAKLLGKGVPAPRVTELGVYRCTWTADDVHRVVEHLTPPPPPPAPTPPKPRLLKLPVFTGEPLDVVLTPAQAGCLQALCAGGMSNADIGRRQYIAEDTVKTHIRLMLARLGAQDRTHAVVLVLTGAVRVHVSTATGPPRNAQEARVSTPTETTRGGQA